MKKYKIIFLLIMISINAYSQNRHDLSIGSGISKAMGSGSEDWNLGFNINGDYFYNISKRISIGGHLAYNKWNIKGSEIARELFGDSDTDFNVKGSKSMIEVLPSIKITPFLVQNSLSRLFIQSGIGYYFVNSEMKISYLLLGQPGEIKMGGKDDKIGIDIGVGLKIGNNDKINFAVCPIYNIIFVDDEKVEYLSLNVRVIFF